MALIAHYKMNDDTANTTVVDSVGEHDGTSSSNTSTMSVTGKVNKALSFNGSNKITIPHSIDFSMHDESGDLPFSLSLWIKMDSGWAELSGEQYIIIKQQALGGEWLFLLQDSFIRLACMDTDNSEATIDIDYDMSEISSGWCHLAVTYNGSGSNTGFSLYINGDEVSAIHTVVGTYVQMRTLTGASSFIGGGFYATSALLCDGIDDIRVYKNTELSSAQVSRLYNNGDGTEVRDILAQHRPLP